MVYDRLKRCSLDALTGHDRATAALARLAEKDCWNGTCSALLVESRIKDGTLPIDSPYFDADLDCIGFCYASSTGSSERWMGFECPECGSARLSTEDALQCCTETDDAEYERDDVEDRD